ncbi:hypothetical protein E3O11_16590 [Cryobacterium levicorallinum]|uniref:Glycosyltransferase RgtA/B/C/D-like domain-containing protein n=1 Tax=Cryobacterium levicorallinum TaxID=995038 RepID=A0A1I3E0J0_9MICO|nr:hypothetical protein [Cryobacterium levicorallinum]TFB81517.1 hypothetical protein E3O11_16590 [Cryobacterium levicorallinum]GEP28561.1 hypothetical protein CLE01_31590 [Cryobacterium levicorallinum]SFH92465.1 hypothetical protein SAMN05216274_1227 [Cryobacterium levicorallinum]
MTFIATLAIATFIVVGLGTVTLAGHFSRTLAPTVFSFGIHILAALSIYHTVGLGAPDAEYYDRAASSLALGGPEVSVTAGKEGWVLLLAAVYSRLGHVPELGLVLNATFAALTVCIAGRIAAKLSLPVSVTAWITAAFPSGIFWSSLLLRESVSWLLIGLCALAFAGLASGRVRLLDIALVLAALSGLLLVRGTAAIAVAAAGFIAIAYVRRRYLSFLLGALACALIVVTSPLGARLNDIIGGITIETFNTSRTALSRAAATSWPTVEVHGLSSAWEAFLVAFPRVMFGPYPWEWPSMPVPFALDGLVWLVILGLTIRGCLVLKDRRVVILLLPAAALLAALIVGSGNYGTMERLRIQSTFLLIPVAAAGYTSLIPRMAGRSSETDDGKEEKTQEA